MEKRQATVEPLDETVFGLDAQVNSDLPSQPVVTAAPGMTLYDAQGNVVQLPAGYVLPAESQVQPGADPYAASYYPGVHGAQAGVPGGRRGQVPGVPGVPRPPPVPIQMMTRPAAIPGVPAGLEYLSQIDQLLVHQQIELFEMMTSWETHNRYVLKNTLGQQVYFAHEETDECQLLCFGAKRGFVMHITDNLGQEVIRVIRKFKCTPGWNFLAGCGPCSMDVQIEAPVGHIIGSVTQEWSVLSPTYGVYDSKDRRVLGLKGPAFFCQCVCRPKDIEFKISSDEQSIGKISKQWTGQLREAFTDADNFGVTFPMDLDVRIKAVMLGAVFLIDYRHFEYSEDCTCCDALA